MRIVQFAISISLSLLTTGLFSQSLDSLKRLLKSSDNTPIRIQLLTQLGEGYLNKRDTLALKYFEELVALSNRSDDLTLKAYAYYRMGVCRYQQNDIRRSTDLYFKGLEVTTESPEFDEIKSKLNNAIGWNLDVIGKYQDAIKYFRKAEFYSQSIENLQLKGLIYNNKGVSFKNLKQYDSALLFFQKSLSLNRKNNSQRQVRFNLNNIGTLLCELRRFGEARIYVDEALSLNTEAKDTLEIINNLLNLSFVNIEENKLKEANSQLNTALYLAINGRFLEQQRRIYNSLMSIAEHKGSYFEAFEFQKEFYRLTDSLYRKGNIQRVQEIEGRYNSLMKDRDLQKARKDAVEQRLYLSLFMAAFLVTVVVIFFLWRSIRIKRANEKMLMKLNQEIKIQAEELRQANEEISVTNENLEQLVKNRTDIIQAQNKRLIQFAFMNSHKIRGPLATLMGLVNMLHDGRNTEDTKEVVAHLKTTTAKMDEIIHEVSRELEKEDQL